MGEDQKNEVIASPVRRIVGWMWRNTAKAPGSFIFLAVFSTALDVYSHSFLSSLGTLFCILFFFAARICQLLEKIHRDFLGVILRSADKIEFNGVTYIWDSCEHKDNNGGTVIDPDKMPGFDIIKGAVGDGIADDTEAVRSYMGLGGLDKPTHHWDAENERWKEV